MRRFLLAAAFAFASFAPASSQNIKISSLPDASAPTGTEVIPIVQSGATKKITVTTLLSGIGPYQPLDSDLTSIAGLTTTTTGRDLLTSSDAAAIRSKAGLGSIATQSSSSVSITGGSITGITDLAVADGGTGASNAAGARAALGVSASGADSTYAFRANNLSDLASASTARTNLGLGTLATQSGTFSGTSSGTNTGDETKSSIDTKIGVDGVTTTTFYRRDGTWAAASGGGTVTLTGDVTGSGTGTFATAIGTNVVTRSMLSQATGATVLGATAAGNVADLTAAQGRTVLGVTATGADTAYAFRTNNLSDVSSASASRTNLGLGDMATQTSSAVSITGGTVVGITDLAVADGGTGASTASAARTNLGAAASGANSDITSLTGLTTPPTWRHPGYVSGRWYVPFYAVSVSSSTLVANTIRFRPVLIEQSITVSNLTVTVTTAVAGNIQLAIYAADPTTKYPTGSALSSTSSSSTGATGVISTTALAANVSLTPGLYWMAENSDAGPNLVAEAGSTTSYMALIGSTTQSRALTTGPGDSLELRLAQTFGTWPNVTSSTFTEAGTPGILYGMKISSVP